MTTKGKISVAFDGQEKPAVTEKEEDFRTEVAPTIKFNFEEGEEDTKKATVKGAVTLTVDEDTQKVKAGKYEIKTSETELVTIEVAEEDTAKTIAEKVKKALEEEGVTLEEWNLAEIKKESDDVTIVIEATENGTGTDPKLTFAEVTEKE